MGDAAEEGPHLADDLEDEILGQQVRRHLALKHETQRRRHLLTRNRADSVPMLHKQ